MTNNLTKTMLLRSTILVGVAACAVPALAQTASGAVTTAPSAAPVNDADAIVVTGSLIRNPNLVRSTPVTVTSADEIALKQSNVAEEVLRDIPGVVPSIGSAVNNGNAGASYVDLRGIGSNRNLVLLDGKRIAPSGFAGRVDLNNIPLALVDRVEALTGAAVTTYGADAVSGVVNFVTKQNFTGIDFSGSEQITGRGDGNTFRTDLTIGGNFADDKGNAVLSIGYQHADPVFQGDRPYSVNNIDSFSGANSGSSTSVPSRFTGTRRIDPATGLPSTIAAFSGFDPVTGKAIPNALGFGASPARYINPTTGLADIATNPFNFNPYNIFQTPFQRYNIYGQAKYAVSDAIEFYTRGLFSKNTVRTIIAPSGVFGSAVAIPLSNPYLPAGLRAQLCAQNVAAPTASPVLDAKGNPVDTQVINYTPRFTPAQCAAAAVATNPNDPNYRTVTTTLQRRLAEGGPRISEYTTTIFDYHLGARGKLSDHLDWDINGSYGQSENRQSIQGYTALSRVKDALLATNTTTCLSGNAGCVPLNIFGPLGSITPAQAAYLTINSSVVIKTSLAQAGGSLVGDLGFNLPTARDPISFAVGAEYRKYTASQDPDSLAQQAGELGGAGGAQPVINGGYDVREVYGELIAPLVQDKPFFQSLTFEAGVRYSDYKVNAPSNPSYSTTTYKAGGSWEPATGLKFRGNYSRAVRAPNIGELFTPFTTGLTNLAVDPCSGIKPNGNATLRAICLAQGAPAGTIGNIIDPTGGQANEQTGGSLSVRPEKADTYTIGVVFQPTFVRNFSVTVDYYKIKVNGAITTPTPGDAIGDCFNAANAGPTLPACTVIRRNPVTGGLDGDPATTPGLFLPLSNLGKINTDGIDVTANFAHDIGFAKLGLSFLGNYTLHSKFQATPTSINRECVGFYSTNCGSDGGFQPGSIQPKFQWTQRTTLGFNDFDLSLQWRHIDSVRQEPLDADPANSGPAFGNFGRIGAKDYFDLSGRVNVGEHLTLTLTVQNLLDKQPPIVGSTIGSTAFNSGNTYPSTYDTLGRRFAFGARIRY